MQSRFKAVRLAMLASLAASGMAAAQQPPATSPTPNDQTSPAGSPPSPEQGSNPAASSPQPDAVTPAGVAGGTSGGERKKGEEEILVTGSRLRRKDLTTAAPVTVISREQITSSGIASIGDFLQQMPEQGGALNTNVNNGGDGQTQISLRNLGSQRTLVLVDGKRWVAGGSGAGTAVDLNSIPTAAIERVEVLKDGASAVYGSDAIGGVVNIITRRRINATEINAYGGVSPHGDGQQYDLNVSSGVTGDKGSFMFSAGYFDQKSMLAGNRAWATTALSYDYPTGTVSPGGSGTIPQGRVQVDPSTCPTQLCKDLAAAFGPGKRYFMPALPGDAAAGLKVVDGFRAYRAAGAQNDLYNYQSINYLITPSQRISLFSNGDYHIADFARAYFQGSFVNRQAANQLAPEPLVTQNFGVTVDKANQYNPFGVDLPNVRRRLVEYSGRTQGFDLDTVRAVGGIDGTLPDVFGPLQGAFWDLSFNYGRTSGVTTTFGSLNTLQTQAGLGPSFNGQCGTKDTAPLPNCTPVNLFGGAGTITPDQITALGGYKGINQGFTQLVAIQANTSAELFKLASERSVGLAAGYEYRQQYGGVTPNAIAQAGNDSDYNGKPTVGSFHVNEAYAELVVPLLSGVPLASDLELQAAGRVFNYSTFGSDTTYKLGGRWRPIRDVTFRGTYSTAFRAPDVADLFGGAGPSAEPARDPCAGGLPGSKAFIAPGTPLFAQCGAGVANNGDDSTQINSTVGGNAKLKPETAKIGTVGVVFEPTALRGLSATFDYYTVSLTQALGFVTTPVRLAGCYPAATGSAATPNSDYCASILRTGGVISNVLDLEQNVGGTLTQGIDFAVRYTFAPTDFGRFGVIFDSTYLLKYDQTLASGQVIKAAGNYDLGSGSAVSNLTPHVKFNVGVNYGLAGFNAGVRGRYIGGYNECADATGGSLGAGLCSDNNLDDNGNPFPHHRVTPNMTMDLIASYLLKGPFGNTTLSAGVRNLIDTNPPRVYNAFLSYTDPGYDLVGRFVYGRIAHQF